MQTSSVLSHLAFFVSAAIFFLLNMLTDRGTSRYISGDSMSSLLWFWHADNMLLPNPAWW
jgi:hypothetical protein